jgi:hypothetical protein
LKNASSTYSADPQRSSFSAENGLKSQDVKNVTMAVTSLSARGRDHEVLGLGSFGEYTQLYVN